MKNNPQQFNLQKTKLKVAAGYSFMLVVFVISVFLVYRSFDAIIHSVETMSEDNQELEVATEISKGIVQINNYSTIYTNTFKRGDYEQYIHERAAVSKKINTLNEQLKDAGTDSIKHYFKEYLHSIDTWILLNDLSRKNDFNGISQLISLAEDSISKANLSIPYSSVKIIKETTERNEENTLDAENSLDNKSTSRKKRTKKTKDKKGQNASDEAAGLTKTITEISVDTEIDTAYYQQMEELIGRVKETISDAERTKNYQKKKLRTTELKLLETQALLVSKINHILSVIDIENKKMINQKLSVSKVMAEDSSKQLLYILLVCLFISLVFGHFVFSDISRSSYYKAMLEKEKIETDRLAKAKEDFLANMSHEIRTPLTNIIGLSEQLSVSESGEDKEKLNAIITSSEHLRDIVNDILDLSKIGAGLLRFEQIGFSVQYVIDEILQMFQHGVNDKQLQLISEVNWNGLTPETTFFLGDPVRLKQLMINLLSNSLKFTHEGYVKISVSVTEAKSCYYINCDVEDTGIGIDAEKQSEIFNDFTQADQAIQRHFGGTGLGLSISKKIVELQGGRIWMESEPGRGSVFSFRIPYRKAKEMDYPVQDTVNYAAIVQLKGKKLLVADDDKMIPVVLSPLFSQWGIEYTICHSALEAWQLLQERPFDILMLDLNMPEMSGYELVERLNGDENKLNKDIHLIICSGNLTVEIKEPVSYEVLPKPFKKKELLDVLCNTVAGIKETVHPVSEAETYTLNNFIAFANNDATTLRIFIETFIAQTQNELMEMEQFLQQEDWSQISEVAHKLKNTFGQLEAYEVIRILACLESIAEKRELTKQEISDHIDGLKQVVAAILSSLEKELKHLD